MSGNGLHGLLLIDDEPAQGRLVSAIVARAGWQVQQVADCDAAARLLATPAGAQIHAVLIDQWSNDTLDATDSIRQIHAVSPHLPVLMITTTNEAETAIAAMRAGATDYLVKPISPSNLIRALDSAREAGATPGELQPLTEKISEALGFEEIVGAAPGFRTALAIAAKAARARVPVLIEGESGVGKEVFAYAIHGASSRARRQMVIVNCGAIPPNLIESELFGHERGAFTGAFDRHIGRFADADGSTIFLDEIGELPLDAQVKLLRVVQSGEIQPLGSRRSKIVDVRIIAATNRNLAAEVAAGRFREDLYYRLNVVQLTIPSLRDRPTDIPHLVRHFLTRMAPAAGVRQINIDDAALQLLMRYDWPGNVRQLQNALFRATVLCEDAMLTTADFPQIQANISAKPASPPTTPTAPRSHLQPLNAPAPVTLFDGNGHIRSLDEIEADVIRLAIGHYRGRMSEVARRLGIGRSTLYRKLAELGISDVA